MLGTLASLEIKKKKQKNWDLMDRCEKRDTLRPIYGHLCILVNKALQLLMCLSYDYAINIIILVTEEVGHKPALSVT